MENENIKKSVWKNIIKWTIFGVVLLILNNAKLCGDLQPFYFAGLFVLVWCNQNIFLSCLVYLVGCAVYCPTLEYMVPNFITVGVTLFFYFCHYKLQKPLNVPLLCAYAFLSQLYVLFKCSTNLDSFFNTLTCLVLGVIFLFVAIVFFQGVVLKRKTQVLNKEQLLCGGIFLSICTLGVCNVEVYGIKIASIFAFFLIFIFSRNKMTFWPAVVGMACGFGIALANFQWNYFVIFSLCGVFCGFFMTYHKVFALMSVVLLNVFLNLYMLGGNLIWQNYVEIGLAFVFYLLLNKHCQSVLDCLVFENKEKQSLKNVVNRSRECQCRKLLEVSKVFNEMDHTFCAMAKGKMPKSEAQQMLVQELSQAVCKDCLDRSHCLQLSTKETLSIFGTLVSSAMSKGKISLLDVPSGLSQKCTKINLIINTVNNMIAQYKQYTTMQANMDASKLLVGEQFGGIAKILENIANELGCPVVFDSKLEDAIIEELCCANIDCNEAVVYKTDASVGNVAMLVVRKSNLWTKKISSIVSKILKSQVCVCGVSESVVPNYSNVFLQPTPKYDVAFGSAQATKAGNEQCGDTHSFLRLNDDKILLAISDGMGSGDKARKTSVEAISMIENYYKAGFDNATILQSVNKLLTLSSNEVFSALDILVVDLKVGVADIVKIGAPASFVKRKFETEILQGGSLPLGILEELKPSINQVSVQHGDDWILVSDGVIDSFGSVEILQAFINNLDIINPQILAERILYQAVENDKQAPNDDMTVVVGRIVLRIE